MSACTAVTDMGRTALETYLADVVRASFTILPYDEAARDVAWPRACTARCSSPTDAVRGRPDCGDRSHERLGPGHRDAKDFTQFEGLEVQD